MRGDEFDDDIGAGFDEDPRGSRWRLCPGDDDPDRAAPDQGGQDPDRGSSDGDDTIDKTPPDDYPVDVKAEVSRDVVMDEIGNGHCFALLGWDRKYVRAAGMKDGRITMEMVYLPGSREWPDGRVERCRSLDEGPYFEVFPE